MLLDRVLIPLNVNVTHFFPCDALFIQKDVFGVPDNHPQDIPKRDVWGKRIEFACVRAASWCAVYMDTHFLAFRGVMLKGGPGGPKLLGKTSTHIWSFPCGSGEDG